MELVDGTYFTIIAGTEKATSVYPATDRLAPGERRDQGGGDARRRRSAPHGGTAMGTWLAHVRGIVGQHQGALIHAILLTDGKDEHETPKNWARKSGSARANSPATAGEWAPTGTVEELRAISTALLGTVDIVADPADLADDFAAMMRASMGKSIPDLTLRLWTPPGARVEFVKQVAPTVEDLTHRRVDAGNQMRGISVGLLGRRGPRLPHPRRGRARGGRTREAGCAGERRRGRPVLGEGLVKAVWTADTALSARISRRVAHYTGQAELAQAVQEGLSARKDGDVADRDRQTAARDGTRGRIGQQRNSQAAARSG